MIRNIKVKKWLVALAAVSAIGGGFAATNALAGSAPIVGDPIDHALGLDDPEVAAQIQEAQVLRQATYDRWVRTCLAAGGFSGVPEEPVSARQAKANESAVSDDDYQRASGFGVTEVLAAQGRTSALVEFIKSLAADEAERLVTALEAPGGCRDTANETAYGDLLRAGDAYDTLESAMYERLSKLPTVKAANAAWRSCMGNPTGFDRPSRIAGYLIGKRNALASDDSAGMSALHEEEMRLSSLDLRCRRTFIDPVFEPLLKVAEAKFVIEHGDVIARLKAALQSG